MASTYPTSVDSFPAPAPTDLVENVNPLLDHDQQHANANDAINKIETFIGITSAPAGAGTLNGRVKTLEAAGGGGTADPNLGLYSGLKAWNFDLQWSANLFTPTTGRLYFQKLAIPAAITVNSIKVFVQDITGTTTTGFYGALYNSAGTLLSQSATVVPAFDVNTLTLAAPQAIAAGNYFACIWWVFSGTAPKLYASVNNNSYQKNVTLTSPNLRVGYANTGLTTTAPGTMGAQTSDNSGYWTALG